MVRNYICMRKKVLFTSSFSFPAFRLVEESTVSQLSFQGKMELSKCRNVWNQKWKLVGKAMDGNRQECLCLHLVSGGFFWHCVKRGSHHTMGQNQVILRHQKFTFPRAEREWAKWASERTSEWCERMSEWTSEWPSTYVSILVCSRPQWSR